jgi:hypothetical protein
VQVRVGGIASAPRPRSSLASAFAPVCFRHCCPSPAAVEAKLQDAESLDFNLAPEKVPAQWIALREKARHLLGELGVRRGDLTPVSCAGSSKAASARWGDRSGSTSGDCRSGRRPRMLLPTAESQNQQNLQDYSSEKNDDLLILHQEEFPEFCEFC